MNATTPISLRALTRDEARATVAGRRVGRPWAPDYPTPGDVNVANAAIDGKIAFASDAMPWGLYVIVEESSGLSIGGIGIKSTPNERGEVEIGYGVCHSFQGRGVATQAVLAICDVARNGATTILAETERGNVASQRVLEKCGFQVVDANDQMVRWRAALSSDANNSL